MYKRHKNLSSLYSGYRGQELSEVSPQNGLQIIGPELYGSFFQHEAVIIFNGSGSNDISCRNINLYWSNHFTKICIHCHPNAGVFHIVHDSGYILDVERHTVLQINLTDLLIIRSASSSERSKLRIDVSISIVERIEMPIMDVTNIPPFMIKFSEYGEFATLSRKRSIIYIRIKMRASALFDLQYFYLSSYLCTGQSHYNSTSIYSLIFLSTWNSFAYSISLLRFLFFPMM